MDIFGKPKRKPRPKIKAAPQTINNYEVNKPMIAKSLNVYPKHSIPRKVEEVKPVVNAKVAGKNLIHKPVSQEGQVFFPVVEKVASSGLKKNTKPGSRNTKKKTG